VIALAATSGVASAKGNLVEIGISGGGIGREVRIVASNEDFSSGWGAPQRPSAERFYTVTFYVSLPGEGRVFPASPMRYYPARGALPAVFMQGDGSHWSNWTRSSASLARRLDDAIAAARRGRPIPNEASKAIVTSWTALGVDVLVVLTIGGTVAAVRRRRLQRGSTPAPAAPA
jgi:hypothetical protein